MNWTSACTGPAHTRRYQLVPHGFPPSGQRNRLRCRRIHGQPLQLVWTTTTAHGPFCKLPLRLVLTTKLQHTLSDIAEHGCFIRLLDLTCTCCDSTPATDYSSSLRFMPRARILPVNVLPPRDDYTALQPLRTRCRGAPHATTLGFG